MAQDRPGDCFHRFRKGIDGILVCEQCGTTMSVEHATPALDMDFQDSPGATEEIRRRRTDRVTKGFANFLRWTGIWRAPY